MKIPFDTTWQFVSREQDAARSRSVWTNGVNGPMMKTRREINITERRMTLMVNEWHEVSMDWEYRTRVEAEYT